MSERQGRCPGPRCHKITRSQEIFQKRSASLSHSLLPFVSRSSVGKFLDDQIFNSQEGSSGLSCASANPGPSFQKDSVASGSMSMAAERLLPAGLGASLGPCRIRGMLLQPKSPQACSDTHSDLYPFIQTDL